MIPGNTRYWIPMANIKPDGLENGITTYGDHSLWSFINGLES